MMRRNATNWRKGIRGGAEAEARTWGASAGLSDAELLVRGAAIATGLPGKDGGLGQSLRRRERRV